MGLMLAAAVILIRLIYYFSKPPGGYRSASHNISDAIETYEEPEIEPFYLYTNSPKSWGRISDKFIRDNASNVREHDTNASDLVFRRREYMLNSLVLLGEIRQNLEANSGVKTYSSYSDALLEFSYQNSTSCCIEKLCDKGVISIAGVVVDTHERYGVILLDTPTPISYIEELRPYFIADGYKDLIYYAVDDPLIVTEPRRLKFEPFNKWCFKFVKNKQGAEHRKYNKYATWWAGISEDNFLTSSVRNAMETYLDLIDHHNSYALGVLSFAFGLKDDNSRTALPDYDEVIMEGPEGVQIIMSVSQQTGITFHFPALPRYGRYRDNFIKVFVNFCYEIRSQILQHDLPEDDFGQPSTLVWFRELIEDVKRRGNVTEVGAIYQ